MDESKSAFLPEAQISSPSPEMRSACAAITCPSTSLQKGAAVNSETTGFNPSTRGRRWCIFTSAGDYNNVLSWVAGLEDREWDLIVAFYGKDETAIHRLRPVCRALFRMQGSKFQNLKKLVNRQPGIFAQYEFIWVADDDLIVTPADVARLFQCASDYDFWISQPAFSGQGRISHPVTAWGGIDSSVRIVNFIEVTCPLFRKDKLDEFLTVYDGELVGWGIDWWFCNHFEANRKRKLAVIDEVVVINPHDYQRRGRSREIGKLEADEIRYGRWVDVCRNLHLAEYEPRTIVKIQRSEGAPVEVSYTTSQDVLADIRRDLPHRERRVIFDVGANTGQSTLQIAKQFPEAEIHCFEPVPEIFQKLSDAVKSWPNVQPHCLALSRESGERPMDLQDESAMNRFSKGRPSARSTIVPITTLSEFCREHGIDHIDFLKIDTTGHDLEVIRGAEGFLDQIDFLQCVTSANSYNRFHAFFGEVWQDMFRNNFYLYRVCEQTKEWANGGYPLLRRFDSVFIHTGVVGPLKNVLDQ